MAKGAKRLIVILFSAALGVVLILVLGLGIYYKSAYPFDYREDILLSARHYNLKPEIVASVINAESSYNKDAYSRAGAIGLMQILPSTAEYITGTLGESFSEDMLWDVSKNIEIGCCYIRYLSDKFQDTYTSLAAYNAGEGTVRKWLKNPEFSDDGRTLKYIPYVETQHYIKKIKAGEGVYKNKF